MLREHLKKRIEAVIRCLIAEEKLPAAVGEVDFEILDTRQPEHGDYACNLAMVAAKKAGMNPRQLGETLRSALLEDAHFEAVDVAGPGFLNLRLRPATITAYLPAILARGAGHARSQVERPLRLNVEFVSVNPNGPITVGSGRGAAFGDTLSRVFEAVGHTVAREYYVNDGVNSEQMKLFAESVRSLALGNPVPERGYKGEYVADIADRLLNPGTAELVAIDERIDAALVELEHHINNEANLGFKSEGLGALRNTLLSARDQLRAEIDARDFGSVATEATGDVTLNEDAQQALREAVRGLTTERIQQAVQAWMVDRQRGDLALFGIEFDRWFSEQSLHDEGSVSSALRKLEKAGNAYRDSQPRDAAERAAAEASDDDEDVPVAGEALWIASHTNGFGDDKDRVLVRADGRPAYIAADVAYLDDKLETRGFEKSYLILGPDHHGYIGRMYAVYQALGFPLDERGKPARFEIVIFQLVRFMKEGKPAPMRKRDGNIYELRDLIEELGRAQAPQATLEEQLRIGADVARFFYLMRSHDSHMDFDIDLATKQSDENPVFYVQYAHARISSVLRRALDAGMSASGYDVALLTHARELTLIKKILDLPAEVERCSRDYGVHRLTTYAIELARTYHSFYDACRVVQPDEPALSAARLALCEATRLSLKASLDLLGVSAPERMERASPVAATD